MKSHKKKTKKKGSKKLN